MTKSCGARHGPHVALVNSRNYISEQHSREMAEGPSDYGKKNTDLVSWPFTGSWQGGFGSGIEVDPHTQIFLPRAP